MRRTGTVLAVWLMLTGWASLASGATLAGEDPKTVRIFQNAQAAFRKGRYRRAAKGYGKVAARLARSEELAERAQFMEAESYFRRGQLIKAYRLFERLLGQYPRTDYFDDVIDREYNIGVQCCKGHKHRFMIVFKVSSGDFGVAVLERVIERAPRGKYADLARMRIANYYLGVKDYNAARDHYDMLLVEYPDSPSAPQARRFRALALQRSVRGTRYNAGSLLDAEAELLEAKRLDKGAATQEQIGLALEQLREKQLDNDYETAKFYLRQGHVAAAALCFEVLIEKAPHSRYARYARAALAELAKPGEGEE